MPAEGVYEQLPQSPSPPLGRQIDVKVRRITSGEGRKFPEIGQVVEPRRLGWIVEGPDQITRNLVICARKREKSVLRIMSEIAAEPSVVKCCPL
jgi:hypothetical protein